MLVISHDVFNARSGTVIAVALTSQPPRAGFPLTLEVRSLRPSEALMGYDQSDSHLSVERIGKRLAKVIPEELAQVVEGLNEIVGV